VLLAGFLANVASASASKQHQPLQPDAAGEWEFRATGLSPYEYGEPEHIITAIVGDFDLGQHAGGKLGGGLGGGFCDTGEYGSINIAGSISGSSLMFTATATPPLECELEFEGTLSGETMTGTWHVSFGEAECEPEQETCEGEFTAKRLTRYPSEEEEDQEKKERKEAQEAEVDPVVEEVVNSDTGLDTGSILGNESLQITGSGFVVPEGWRAEVQFYAGGEEVGHEPAEPNGSQIETASPDLALRAAEAHPGLPVEARVRISGENEEGEEQSVTSPASQADVFEELTPAVTSVDDTSTRTNSGPIAGGDTLRVKGSGFLVPDGGSAHVDFYVGGENIEAVTATSVGEDEIEVQAPNLTKYESKIPAGKEALPTDVRVEITSEGGSPGENAVLSPESTGDLYEALSEERPVVSSVTDESSDNDQGSIFGGETLQIDGSGFNVPEGGKAQVSFELEGEVLGEVIEVTPDSATEIEVKAPDLTKYDSRVAMAAKRLAVSAARMAAFGPDLASTAGDLALEVFVAVENASKKLVSSSASAGDQYDEDGPYVSSVVDEQTGGIQGSILGGDTLKLEGSGFEVPEGGEAKVELYLGSTRVKTVAVEPKSGSLIELETPNLSSLASEVPDGENALALNVVVSITDDEGDEVNTKTNDGPDVYEALIPVVTSVTDVQTGKSSGSILGGDTLKIEGQGFGGPAGVKAAVAFVYDGTIVKTLKAVEPVSSSVIEVEAPDLVSLAKEIPDGKDGLATDVVVGMGTSETSKVESRTEGTGEGADSYDALIPVVKSVTDVQTGKSSGSILGGDTLKIEGENFVVPQGAKAAVAFVYDGTIVKTLMTVEPVSSSVIEVQAPDLASLAKEIPDGEDGLATDVVVAVGTSETNQAQSQTEGTGEGADSYDALIPVVTSVTDVQTGKSSGSILGGDKLRIEGQGFDVPAGGKAAVAFVYDGTIVKTLKTVEPVSSSVIEVEAPDLVSLAKEIPDGEHGLATDIVVGVGASETDKVESRTEGTGEGADSYEALIPVVTSVKDVQTGKSSGSILGGDTLRVEGENLVVPEGGKAAVAFVYDGKIVETLKAVEPVSSSVIEVQAPDLASLAKEIPDGEHGLATDVVVAVGTSETNQVQSQTEGKGEGADAYEALIPVVTSVTDQASASDDGSALGGETLLVKGSGFAAPAGGSVSVSFDDGENSALDGVVVTPVSSSEIELSSPDLEKFEADADDGVLATRVVVSVSDGLSEVSSDEEDDVFDAEFPVVSSVSDAETAASSGPLAGGEELVVEGSGFEVPDGGKASVSFLDGETQEQLSNVVVTPVSDSEIDLSSPDLSADAAKAGKAGLLLTDVRVAIEDREGGVIDSELSDADEFSFASPLTISSPDAATLKVGDEGSFDVSAEGAAPITLGETGALPEGVTFTDLGGGKATLAGTPGEGTAGVYELTITASNGVAPDATQAFTLTVQDVPGAPLDVKAAAGVGSAEVSWKEPGSDGEATIESYVVKTTPGGQSVTVDGSETSAKIEGLTVGVSYVFSVEASNTLGAGPAGESANVVPTSTPLLSPQSATSSDPGGSASTEAVSPAAGVALVATGDGAGTIETGVYASDPVAKLPAAGGFFDVAKSPDSSFSQVSFQVCGVAAGSSVDWWNPAKGGWEPVSTEVSSTGPPACVTVTVNTASTPALTDFYGTIFAILPPGCTSSPQVETQPEGISVKAPATATFTATATTPPGCAAPTVQWYSKAPGATGFTAIAGATGSSYTTPATVKTDTGSEYEAAFKNTHGETTSTPAVLTVLPRDAKLVLSTPTLKEGTANTAYRAVFTLAGGSPPYSFHTTGTIPAGLAWNTSEEADGRIELAGTPTTAETSTFVLEAADASTPALTVSREYTLTVQLALSAGVGKATAGTPYSRQLTAAGGIEPYKYTLTAGALPAGFQLTETGLLSGTPEAAQTSSFQITLSDSSTPRQTRSRQYTLTVQLGFHELPIHKAPAGTPLGERGQGIPIEAFGGSAPYTYQAQTPLPPGLTLTNNTLIGTPTTEGAYTFKIHATDTNNPANTGEHTFLLTITKPRG